MTTQEVKRKLAAILSADVKGYSRLMGEDEEWTVRTLNTYKEVMSNLIQQQRGRVVDAPGDNVLAEFGSVVDAVRCAVEIQKELKTRNGELPENRRMEFRIGVNLGDVIEDGEQILGDGVNIAARVQGLADGGGICISGTAYDQVENKLSLGYEYLGEQAVKNIAKPVRVYRVLMEPEAAGKMIGEKKPKPRQWQMATLGLGIGVIVVVAAVVIWKLYTPSTPQPEVTLKEKVVASPPEKVPTVVPPSTEVAPKEKVAPPSPEKVTKPASPPVPKMEVASKEKMAFPMPDKPSIAVLPFANMSEDPKQGYFCDGLAEEIINALAKLPNIFVIARNSSFSYRGKTVDIRQVGRELGVKYVLEGSVRREGDRIRVMAQLVDAITGNHVFSERYDRELKDIFAIQDDIAMKVLVSVQVILAEGETARFRARGTENLEAYLKSIEAQKFMERLNKDDNALARKNFEEAIALDPKYARAYAGLAVVYVMDFVLRVNPEESLRKAHEFAQKAVNLDERQLYAHTSLEFVYSWRRQYEEAVASGERAVKIAPGSADAYFSLGRALGYACRDREALGYLEKAIRLNPISPSVYYTHLGMAYLNLKQHREAISAFKKSLAISPQNVPARQYLIGTYVEMDHLEEARIEAEELLKINPNYTSKGIVKRLAFKDETVGERLAEALRKVGLERDVDAK